MSQEKGEQPLTSDIEENVECRKKYGYTWPGDKRQANEVNKNYGGLELGVTDSLAKTLNGLEDYEFGMNDGSEKSMEQETTSDMDVY